MNIITMNARLAASGPPASGKSNIDEIRSLLAGIEIGSDSIIVLPEHYTMERDQELYREEIAALANSTGSYVVGGSHHEPSGANFVNAGVAFDPNGTMLGSYSKLRPYASEQRLVSPGERFGEFVLGGVKVMLLICADFWFSDLIQSATVLPDIIIVPALSVSRKPRPDYAKSLWRNLAIARAYEFGVYVAISDWAEDSILPKYRTCGVGGFADPATTDPDRFFQPVGSNGVQSYEINLDILEQFRADRRERGFFWK